MKRERMTVTKGERDRERDRERKKETDRVREDRKSVV